MKKFISCILFFVCCSAVSFSFAAHVDTVTVHSGSMNKNIKCVVIIPDAYKKKNGVFPVVYLLHGYSGDYSDWVVKVPDIKNYADRYNFIIVCPDGAFSSWYFDSPIDSTMKYETHVAIEIPNYIDAHYKTITGAKGRAITGLSMGGHGALFLAFRHQDIFGACGSMSGGVDLHASHNQFDISKRIGDTLHYAENWNKYSVINIVKHYPKTKLAIIFDCGVDDFFYDCNKALHQTLLQLHIAHDYTERPGEHNWDYWANSIKYQLLFFSEYFKRSQETGVRKEN